MKKARIVSLLLVLVLVVESGQVVWGWELERPGGGIDLFKDYRAENAGTNGEASVGLCVSPYHYGEDDGGYEGADTVQMNMSMTTNSRRGISYEYGDWPWNEWYSETQFAHGKNKTNVDEWGDWFSVSPEYQYFTFFGATYRKVYVSSNGFISVNNANLTCPNPPSMPNTQEPNGVIAGCWTDLVIDSSASIWVGEYPDIGGKIWFVVMWKNAKHKASGKRATFEIAISNRANWFQESEIRLNYQNVEANNEYWIYGIEDQEGIRDWSNRWDGRYPLRDRTFNLVQASNTFFLRYLTVKMQDENPNTKLDIWDAKDDIRGYDVVLGANPAQDSRWSFVDVLQTGTILLTGNLGGLLVAGFWAAVKECWNIARNQYNDVIAMEIADQKPSRQGSINIPRGARIRVSADASNQVDASLCIRLVWALNETGLRQNHVLTISANSTYEIFGRGGAPLGFRNVVTSVTLNVKPDTNNDPGTATTINPGTTYERLYVGKYDGNDYYKIYAGQGQKITAHAWATLPSPSAPGPVFYVSICDPSGNSHGESWPSASDVTFNRTTDCAGLWIVKIRKYELDTTYGFYSLNVVVGDGSGGCPVLSVFNGSTYVDEGLLNIHNPDSIDVALNHTLVTRLKPSGWQYLLRLTEHPQTHSYIDQVKLFATLESGVTIQLPLVSAVHSEYGNVLLQLLFSDDWRTETIGANFNNGTSQSIDLKFLALPQFLRIESFTFMIEGHNPWSKE